MLTVDGQNGVELKQGDWIQISKAEHDTYLLVLEKRNFFAVLEPKISPHCALSKAEATALALPGAVRTSNIFSLAA